jgi:exopolysaccharide production protein ExoQ
MTSQSRITRLEFALAGLTLFMFAEAFLPRLLAPGPADVTGEAPESTLLRYLWLPFYGLVAIGLFLSIDQAWRAALRAPWLILLALVAMASAIWSIDPELSFRRGVALLATTMLGVYLAARFDWLSALRLLGAVWFLLMAASLIAGLVAPGFARMSEVHVGAWMGGWSEKNALGGHAARASFLLVFLAWRDPVYRRWWIGGVLLALALVIFSRSATALLGAGLGLGILFAAWWMLKGKRWSLVLVWSGVTLLGLVALAYITMPEVVLGLLGKDETLTGRTDIWASLGEAIDKRPVLGYGYMAFWGLDSEPRYWLGRAVDWNAPSGHNGWLDLAISLGVVGVAIYTIDLVITLLRAGRLSLSSPAGVFALGFLAQFMLFAMSESIIIAQNSILWATYAFVGAKLALGAQASQSMTPLNTAPSVGAARTAPASTARAASSSIRSAGAP